MLAAAIRSSRPMDAYTSHVVMCLATRLAWGALASARSERHALQRQVASKVMRAYPTNQFRRSVSPNHERSNHHPSRDPNSDPSNSPIGRSPTRDHGCMTGRTDNIVGTPDTRDGNRHPDLVESGSSGYAFCIRLALAGARRRRVGYLATGRQALLPRHFPTRTRPGKPKEMLFCS